MHNSSKHCASSSLKTLAELHLKVIVNRVWMNSRNDLLDQVCRLVYKNSKDIEIQLRCTTIHDILAGLIFAPHTSLLTSVNSNEEQIAVM